MHKLAVFADEVSRGPEGVPRVRGGRTPGGVPFSAGAGDASRTRPDSVREAQKAL